MRGGFVTIPVARIAIVERGKEDELFFVESLSKISRLTQPLPTRTGAVCGGYETTPKLAAYLGTFLLSAHS